MMLYKLLSSMDNQVFHHDVISLTDVGAVGKKINSLGVPVQSLKMCRGIPDPWALVKLMTILKRSKPDVIQTWMYHSDLIGGLAAKFTGKPPVCWGIRHSNLDPSLNKSMTIWVAKLCAYLSRWLPSMIVCCSNSSKQVHYSLGYALDKMIVIPNGFDLEAFRPNSDAISLVRDELGLCEDAFLIGLVGRFDPLKDHKNFILAAEKLLQIKPDVHFVLCGNLVDWDNSELSSLIDRYNVRSSFHLLGARQDIPILTAAFDIATSSSSGEGFPNVIGEAMACGVPCVVTDVGDSAFIVGSTGIVVPPCDPNALADAWLKLINMKHAERNRLGESARQRIKEHFSLSEIARCYALLYERVVN